MRKPVAVLISDTHYSLKTYPLADKAYRMAIDSAAQLGVRLIDCGDLTNDKAIIRAEPANALIKTLEYARDYLVQVTALVGNHSLVNEKGKEHALEFIKPYCQVIDTFCSDFKGLCYFIPYQSSAQEFERLLQQVPKGRIVIAHQGIKDALSGEYSFDKSAIDKHLLADYRTILGHYHRAQDIKCGPVGTNSVGLASYVGNPYSLSFSESSDGPKGFQILYDDGTLEQVPTNLRKHVVAECIVTGGNITREPYEYRTNPGDLVWVKVQGPKLELAALSKDNIRDALRLDNTAFKLDKIPTDTPTPTSDKLQKKNSHEIMDMLIASSGESQFKQDELKALWRKVMS